MSSIIIKYANLLHDKYAIDAKDAMQILTEITLQCLEDIQSMQNERTEDKPSA